jgi:hypothetical protein
LSVRKFPVHRDESYREAYFYAKNVESALMDVDCPELENICNVMAIADDLSVAGWKVKISPFETYPILHIRAKRKQKKL